MSVTQVSPRLVTRLVYAALDASTKRVASAIIEVLLSSRFRFSRYLALDLLSEFQGMLDFFEYFGGATGASHDHGSIAEDSSDGGLVNHDAFDSAEKDFDAAPIRDASFCDDPLIGDGHLGGITLQQTDAKEGSSDEEPNESPQIHNAARGHAFCSCGAGKGSNEKRYCQQFEDGGNNDVPQHHNPMQLGLVPDSLAGDEMLFDVAQGSSLD
jgi:hypothetical protein